MSLLICKLVEEGYGGVSVLHYGTVQGGDVRRLAGSVVHSYGVISLVFCHLSFADGRKSAILDLQ